MGKEKKKESAKAIKSVENININLSPLCYKISEISLIFFLPLTICREVQKSMCAFICLQPRLFLDLKNNICVCKSDVISQICVLGNFENIEKVKFC